MDWKKIGLSIVLSAIIVILILSLSSNNQIDYFNQVELSTNNTIINYTDDLSYYDTILSVGLDLYNISDIVVIINPLSSGAKNQFDGDLKAHIRLFNEYYYLFIDDIDRREAIQILAHEIIHIHQYQTKQLEYRDNIVFWQGATYDLNKDYDKRPWEVDAFDKQNLLESQIINYLY